jgi:DNA-binding CsgD family transcriptional regulator
MSETLSLADVRALLRLLGEMRELGDSPVAWRGHLAEQLSQLCGARAVVSSELSPRTPASRAQAEAARAGSCQAATRALAVAHAGLGEADAAPFFRDVIWYDHSRDRTLQRLVPLYGSTFVRSRADLTEDATWYGSELASERFRKHDCDDFIIAMCAVPAAGVICSLELFRPWGAARFGERERLLVQLVQEELSRDFEATCAPLHRLSPRQRQVLTLLRRGLAEKQVAAELGVSPHTVHDYVKALYRLHGVSSRAELLSVSDRGRLRLARDSGGERAAQHAADGQTLQHD